jgi:hypothetical protein
MRQPVGIELPLHDRSEAASATWWPPAPIPRMSRPRRGAGHDRGRPSDAAPSEDSRLVETC